MKKALLFSILLVLPYSGTTSLGAAEIKLGVTAGYNYSHYNSMNFKSLDCTCNPFEEGTGHGYTIGMAAELFRNTFFIDAWVLRIGYQSLPLYENKTVSSKAVTYEGEIIDINFVDELDITNNSIVIDFMYKLNLFGSGFAVSAGPSFGYNSGNHILMREYVPNFHFIEKDGLKIT